MIKEVEVNGKVWTKESIKQLLLTNDKAIERAILVIFSNQTLSEQNSNQTVSNNGIGFNSFDAPILSSFATQLQEGRHLSVKQLNIARKKIIKYSKQLLEYMELKKEY